MFVALVIY